MASSFFNNGITKCNDGTIDLDATSELKVMLMQSSFSMDPSLDYVSDISASELSCTGYTGGYGGAGRKVLSGVTLTNDDTNEYSVIDATDPTTWSSLGAGQTIGGAVIIKEITSDAASIPIFFIDFTDVATGGDFTLQWAAAGIARWKHPA